MKKTLFIIIMASVLTVAFKTREPVHSPPTPKAEGCALSFNVTDWSRVSGVLISNVFGYTSVPYGATGQYSLTTDSTVFVSIGVGNCYSSSFTWGSYTWTWCAQGSSGGPISFPAYREVEQFATLFACACPFPGQGNLHDSGNGTPCQPPQPPTR